MIEQPSVVALIVAATLVIAGRCEGGDGGAVDSMIELDVEWDQLRGRGSSACKLLAERRDDIGVKRRDLPITWIALQQLRRCRGRPVRILRPPAGQPVSPLSTAVLAQFDEWDYIIRG